MNMSKRVMRMMRIMRIIRSKCILALELVHEKSLGLLLDTHDLSFLAAASGDEGLLFEDRRGSIKNENWPDPIKQQPTKHITLLAICSTVRNAPQMSQNRINARSSLPYRNMT